MNTHNPNPHQNLANLSYPYKKVLLGFTLLGGAVGGFLLGLSTEIYYGSYHLNSILFSLLLAFFGIGFGLIPASISGIFLCCIKFYIKNFIDYIKLFVLGWLISAMFFYFSGLKFNDWIFVSSAGGMSAVVCGKLFVPKG